jgi:hypothetical protein
MKTSSPSSALNFAAKSNDPPTASIKERINKKRVPSAND